MAALPHDLKSIVWQLCQAFWCLALPGLCHRTLPGLYQRGLGRALDGSGLGLGDHKCDLADLHNESTRQGSRRTTSSQFSWGGASPQIEVCHTGLYQVFTRELCQALYQRFSSLTPMRACGVELCPQGTMERPSYIGTYIKPKASAFAAKTPSSPSLQVSET